MGVERHGLEGFRKGGEENKNFIFFFERERELREVGILNERAKIFWNLINFIFQSFFNKWTIRNFKKMKRFLEILLENVKRTKLIDSRILMVK